LLDAAASMVAAGEVERVSMETVADAAGVSRALVYKHFANRRELLSRLYARESARLHAELAAAVEAAERNGEGLTGMLRALIHGSLAAQSSRGATFAALTASGGRSARQRDVQRRRDRRTLRYFAQHAALELGVEPRAAAAGLAIALSSISSVLGLWEMRPTAEHAATLEDTFVAMTMGGLERIARGEEV
jgi:AcrR family transcriptional regulator